MRRAPAAQVTPACRGERRERKAPRWLTVGSAVARSFEGWSGTSRSRAYAPGATRRDGAGRWAPPIPSRPSAGEDPSSSTAPNELLLSWVHGLNVGRKPATSTMARLFTGEIAPARRSCRPEAPRERGVAVPSNSWSSSSDHVRLCSGDAGHAASVAIDSRTSAEPHRPPQSLGGASSLLPAPYFQRASGQRHQDGRRCSSTSRNPVGRRRVVRWSRKEWWAPLMRPKHLLEFVHRRDGCTEQRRRRIRARGTLGQAQC